MSLKYLMLLDNEMKLFLNKYTILLVEDENDNKCM